MPLAGIREDLEDQTGTVDVRRQEPELVDREQADPGELGRLAVVPALLSGTAQSHHERRGGEEAGLHPPVARKFT